MIPILRSAPVRCLAALALGAGLLLAGCRTTTTVDGNQVSNTAPVAGATEGDVHKRAMVRLQLASNYFSQGQSQTAIDEAQHALEFDPGLVAAYDLLALVYLGLDQKDKAEENFRHALMLAPNDPELNNNYGWYLCRTGHERDSIVYFERAAADRLYATPGMALQNAGVCLLQLNDPVRAEQYLVRAFQVDASSQVVKFQLAQLYLVQNKLDRAEFYYELLTKSSDPSAESLWLGVRLAHAQGDSRQERKLGNELRGRFPDSEPAAALRQGRF